MPTALETQNRPVRMEPERREFTSPPANISATENEYLLEVDMPGVSKEGLQVMVETNELTIIGRRSGEMPKAELCYCESAMADYRRVFELGPDVDTSKINAEMHNGVLKLHLPKTEKSKPRQIEVKG